MIAATAGFAFGMTVVLLAVSLAAVVSRYIERRRARR